MIPEQYEAAVFYVMLTLVAFGSSFALLWQAWTDRKHDQREAQLQADIDALAVDVGGGVAWPERPRKAV